MGSLVRCAFNPERKLFFHISVSGFQSDHRRVSGDICFHAGDISYHLGHDHKYEKQSMILAKQGKAAYGSAEGKK